jgi:hypothetical protein
VADWFYVQSKNRGMSLVELRDNYTRAYRTLTRAGYRDLGGELWAPPIGPNPSPLLQRISDLEAEREKFAREANKYYQIWKDLAGQPVMNERDQFLDIIRHCYDRAKAHQSKERTGRLRNGAEACRWIAESMQSVIDRYGKEATPSHEINAHG